MRLDFPADPGEAEAFSPAAYHRHVRQFYEGYHRSLRRSLAKGEIEGFSESDLGPVVFMLMGMRSYMTTLYQYEYIDHDALTLERLVEVYCRLVSQGLYKSEPGKVGKRSGRKAKPMSRPTAEESPTSTRLSRAKTRPASS